jgi:hypothetical protein
MVKVEGEPVAGALLLLLALAGTETPEHAVSQRSNGSVIRATHCNKILLFAQFFGV